jgi:pilus assembly protein CpaB
MLGRGSAPTLIPERQRAYIPEFNVVEVPVPNIPVSAGTLVRDIPIRMERFPSHQLPSEVVRDVSVVRNSVALVALPGGLPMVATNLGAPDELSNPIVGRIPPGMRAMTVRVDATAAVEGWARSGSIVDVLLVEQTRTTVVAEQVKVISAERSLSPGAEDASMPIPSTVTLLVTQEQCLAINTAVGLGKIAFALRSARDPDGWRTTQFSAAALSDDRAPKNPARVSGVVAVGSGAARRRYALVDGAWIPTEQVPTGFLLGEEPDANGGQRGEE